jgi:hypothetical protein
MEAFFLVPLEKKKQHPSAADVFLPLEEMMRLKLHDSLPPTLQTQLNEIWNANFKGSIESLKECHCNIADISLPSQRKIQH